MLIPFGMNSADIPDDVVTGFRTRTFLVSVQTMQIPLEIDTRRTNHKSSTSLGIVRDIHMGNDPLSLVLRI